MEVQSIAGDHAELGWWSGQSFIGGKSAIVVAVNVETLVAEVEEAKGMIEFAPEVGDFVGSAELLFLLRDGAHAPSTNGNCGYLSSLPASAQWSRTRSLGFTFLSTLRIQGTLKSDQ